MVWHSGLSQQRLLAGERPKRTLHHPMESGAGFGLQPAPRVVVLLNLLGLADAFVANQPAEPVRKVQRSDVPHRALFVGIHGPDQRRRWTGGHGKRVHGKTAHFELIRPSVLELERVCSSVECWQLAKPKQRQQRPGCQKDRVGGSKYLPTVEERNGLERW